MLDAFQKKSKKGSQTPMVNMDRIKSRLKLATDSYQQFLRRMP